MDIKKYAALQKVVELGGFSRAADALGYTQSAVSQMVSSMEDEMGVRMLNRSHAGVSLTPEGQRLYPLIERVLATQQLLQMATDEICGLDTGLVRVGTLTCISNCWMPQLMRRFEQDYPNVQFDLKQGDYTSVQDWVKTGIVDFGFMNPAAMTGLQSKPVKEGEMLAVLPVGHPLCAHERVPLRLLAQERFILLDVGCHSEPLEAFAQAGVTPDVRYRIQDAYAIMAMVEGGLGVSILAKMLLDRAASAFELRPCDPPVTRPMSVVYKDWDTLPVSAKRFINLVCASADDLA